MKRWKRTLLLACLCGSITISPLALATERYLHEAQQYFDKGDLNAAIIQLKNALQREPDLGPARLLLGRSYLEQGDGASAEKELELALSQGEDRDRVLLLLGRAWLLQGKADRVLEGIDVDGQQGEALAERHYLRGQALAQRGDADLAESHFAQALGAFPQHVDTLVAQARLLHAKGDREGAGERLAQALKLRTDHADAWALDGDLKRQAGQLEAAEDRYNRALALQPLHLGAYLGRATLYLAKGQPEAAERDIQQILRRAPRHPIALYLQGLVAYQQGKHDDAANALQQGLAVLPDHSASLLLLGTIRYEQGQYHQAVHHLRPFVKAHPGHVPGAKILAAALLRNRQSDAAIEVLEAAAGLAPEDAQLLAMLGSAYLNRGDSDSGLEYLRKAAELAPDTAAIQAQLGIGHILAGDARQATQELEAAVNLGQGLFQADILLVMSYLNGREADKALAAARALQAKLPDDPMPHNLLGVVHLQRGDGDAARGAFDQALDARPAFAPALLNLARMNMAAGELERARARFQQVLAGDATNLDAMYGMVDLAHRQGRQDQVEQWLERARQHHPAAVKPSVLLAEQYLRTGQALKALDVARALHEQRPDQADALRVLGQAQMATDSTAAGVASFRRLAELLPNNARVQYLLGGAAVKNQDSNLARVAFHKVLELEPQHAGALSSLGGIHLGAGETEEAQRYSVRLLEHHADQPWGYALAAEILISKGEFAGAAAQAREAYLRDGSQARLLRYYQLLKQTGEHAQAASLLQSWLQEHPLDDEMRLRAAMDLQAQGEERAATSLYEQLLERQPGNVIALNNLAWLNLEHDPGMAIKYAERAYQVSPERPEVLDTYGWALVRSGRAANGLPYLQEALLKAPHLSEVRYHVAFALHAAGRQDEARKELDRLQGTDKAFAQSVEFRELSDQLR